MRALIVGFVGFFVIVLGIAFLIQYPAVFWVLISIMALAFAIGIIKGRKQTVLRDAERESRRKAALNRIGGISEGDIVHHHQPNGRPFDDGNRSSAFIAGAATGAAAAYILRPDAKEATSAVEVDPEIENAAAMYYEGNDSYSDEEGEY